MNFLYNLNLPIALLFALTVMSTVVVGTYKANYIKRYLKNSSEFYLINAGLSIVVACMFFAFGGFTFAMSKYTLLLGLFFGVVTMVFCVFNSMAVKAGPYGYTSVIVNFSTGITALSGAIFWDEELGIFKIIGIVLILLSFYFAVDTKKDENGKKASLRWFILCILTLLFCALLGLMQKIQQMSDYSGERNAFLLIAFIVSAIFSFALWQVEKKREIKRGIYNFRDGGEDAVANRKRALKTLVLVMIFCGICSFINNDMNLYLAGKVDTAIFFPIVNGIPLMVSIMVSFFFFKEKLKVKQWIGLVIGVLAIAALCL